MKPQELLGVFVRALGLLMILAGVQVCLGVARTVGGFIVALLDVAIGVGLILAADQVVRLCYTRFSFRGPAET